MNKVTSLILATLLQAPLASLHADDAPKPRPNIIIILADDQGYGDLSCTGNPIIQTPHMDALRNEGLQLVNFHVDACCTPSRAAIMTGRFAHRVGGWGTVSGRDMLRDGEVTMADVFRCNDYRTGHFGKWHLGGNYNEKLPDNAGEDSVSLLPAFLGTADKPLREAVVHHSMKGA